MSHYCGIDLHSNNHVVVMIDEEDKRVNEKRLGNDLSLTLKALSPYRESLQGVAVESTFNWYWLVDGLQEHGYDLQLVNTAASVKTFWTRFGSEDCVGYRGTKGWETKEAPCLNPDG